MISLMDNSDSNGGGTEPNGFYNMFNFWRCC